MISQIHISNSIIFMSMSIGTIHDAKECPGKRETSFNLWSIHLFYESCVFIISDTSRKDVHLSHSELCFRKIFIDFPPFAQPFLEMKSWVSSHLIRVTNNVFIEVFCHHTLRLTESYWTIYFIAQKKKKNGKLWWSYKILQMGLPLGSTS